MEYPVNPVRVRINKIFDGHFIADSANTLNSIAGYNIPISSSKRVLLNEIEKRDLLINKAIIFEYAKVKEKLQGLYGHVVSLQATINTMSSRLNESKTKTHHLITQTTRLRDESKKTEKKLLWVNSLIDKFHLTTEQTNKIYSMPATTPVTEDFILLLNHIEKLHESSKVLVKSWYQTSAFDIMELIGLQQEAAIEKLYHWTISATRSIDSPNNSLISKALAKFLTRQVLFSNVLDEYCTARKTITVQKFIDVLTQGKESGSKPVEFYADDPTKYLGDIMSWLYQQILTEKENLLTLLKYCEIEEKNLLISESLTLILETICPLLKVRVELILKPTTAPLTLWSVSNRINHFMNTILLHIPQGHLITTFEDLIKKSEEVFITSLDNKVQKDLTHGVKASPSDLSPSGVVTELVCFLRDLLAAMNSTESKNIHDKKIVFTHILDPLLHAINETACHLSSTDMAVYMLNCIYHIQCTLALYTVMDEYNERLQAQTEAQFDTLTSEQASYLVANLNLGPIYTILQEKINGPLAAIPGMDKLTLKAFLNKFDLFLGSPDMFLLPQLDLLLSHSHLALIKRRTYEVILAIYQQLYNAIDNPANGYIEGNTNTILCRPIEDVKKLLNV